MLFYVEFWISKKGTSIIWTLLTYHITDDMPFLIQIDPVCNYYRNLLTHIIGLNILNNILNIGWVSEVIMVPHGHFKCFEVKVLYTVQYATEMSTEKQVKQGNTERSIKTPDYIIWDLSFKGTNTWCAMTLQHN
jgi:hypothetical protein